MKRNITFIGAGLLIGIGLGVLILAALGMGGALFSGWISPSEDPEAPAVPEINASAPDFELKSPGGEPYRLSNFEGRAVMINFWATWCGPCRLEMPLIQEYYDRYQPDLVVLAVNAGETKTEVNEFVNSLDLTFPVLMDPGNKIEEIYRVRAFPTTFFIDAEGVIRYQHIGILNETQLVQYLAQIGVGE